MNSTSMWSYNSSDYDEYCSTKVSMLLTSLGMTSDEAVLDYDLSLLYSNMTREISSEHLWFKFKYTNAIEWLSEHYSCDILIYPIDQEKDLWKVTILPSAVSKGVNEQISDKTYVSWSMAAEVAILLVCERLYAMNTCI